MGPNIKSGKPDLMLATRVVCLTSYKPHCKAERNGSHNHKKSAKSFEGVWGDFFKSPPT